jgi:hypothetical protein
MMATVHSPRPRLEGYAVRRKGSAAPTTMNNENDERRAGAGDVGEMGDEYEVGKGQDWRGDRY